MMKQTLIQPHGQSQPTTRLSDRRKLESAPNTALDFLELSGAHEERELETALISNVQRFLTEMGPHFTFVGSQYRLSVEGNDYHIDLLFYHRALKSLIAVELKIGEFQPEHKGKMEFYLVALNAQVKLPDENDAIGIIICKSKKKTVVEYALKTSTQPIGIATYSLTPHCRRPTSICYRAKRKFVIACRDGG